MSARCQHDSKTNYPWCISAKTRNLASYDPRCKKVQTSLSDSSTNNPKSCLHVNWQRCLISAGILLHLIAIVASWLGANQWCGPYLSFAEPLRPYCQATHFRIDGEPIHLTGGSDLESAFRVQVKRHGSQQRDSWKTIQPTGIAGLGGNDRYQRWVTTLLTLVEADQPSLVAELLLPVAARDERIVAIRIIRVDGSENEVLPVYVAEVTRGSRSSSLALVQVPDPRLRTFRSRQPKASAEPSVQGRQGEQ